MSRAARPVRPPPPVPKPGHVKVVRAMYRYEAQQNDELTFDEGDMLYIIDMSNPDWWKAKCGNRSGLIPSNYVESNTETIDCPLHEAAKRGNMDFLRECLQNQVSVNSLDKAGSTPMHWAAHGGHIECMNALLQASNSGNIAEYCIGMLTLCRGMGNMAHMSIGVGNQNKLGDTPLHSAAWKGHAEAVQLLLDHGARADLQNNEKKYPYELAKDPETAALVRQAAGFRRAMSGDYGDEEDSD